MSKGKEPRRITTSGIAVAAVALVVLLIGLYTAHVFSKLSSIKQRNFRVVATLADMTEKKVNNVAKILDSAAGAEGSDAEGWASIVRDHVVDCLAFILRAGADNDSDLQNHLNRLNDLPSFHHVHSHLPGSSHSDEIEPTVEVATSDLIFRREQKDGGILHIEASIDPFFSHLARPEVFNDVLVVDATGRVIFQEGGSSTRIRRLFGSEVADDASTERSSSTTTADAYWPLAFNNFREVELAGQRYTLFRQPVTPDFQQADHDAQEKHDGDHKDHSDARNDQSKTRPQWEVIGLVRSDRLLFDALRISPSVLSLLGVLFLLVLCGLPIFNIWISSTRERLYPWQAGTVALGLAVATALFTILMLDIGLNWRNAALNWQLEKNAGEIEAALATEIKDSVEQLEYLKKRYKYLNEKSSKRYPNEDALFQDKNLNWISDKFHDANGDPKSVRYLHLTMVYWTSTEGKQIAKWAAGKPTPLISVKSREYFSRATNGPRWSPHLWRDDAAQPSKFFVQPIRSWTTGEQEVVFTQKMGGGKHDETARSKRAVGDKADGEHDDENLPVAAMVITKLPSMLRPILPPGCGFAVVQQDGQVVFHSQPERNGVENFVEECEGTPELRGVLLSGFARHFDSYYRGQKHLMYARPLAHLPEWNIVVFQEADLLQTVRFESFELTLVLWLFLMGLLILLLFGFSVLGGRGTIRHLWPGPSDDTSHDRIVAISILMIISLISLVFLHSSNILILGGLLFPLVTVAWLIAAIASGAERNTWIRQAAFWTGVIAAIAILFYEGRAVIGASWAMKLIVAAHLCSLAAAGLIAWTSFYFPATDPDGRKAIAAGSGLVPRIGRHLSATTRFVIAAGSVLAAVSAMPVAVFFWANLQSRLNLEERRAELHLAESSLRRHQEIKTDYSYLENENLVKEVIDDKRDVHYGGYFTTGVEIGKCPGACSNDNSATPLSETLFCHWPFEKLYHLNTHSIEARAVDSDHSALCSPRFESLGSETGISLRKPPLTLSSIAAGGISGIFFTAIVAAGLAFIGRRLFCVDYRPTVKSSLLDFEAMHFGRLLLVVPPGMNVDDAFQHPDRRVDLRTEGRADVPKEGLLRVDNLDAALRSPSGPLRAIQLFGEAFAKSSNGLRIVAFSHSDPIAILEAEEHRIRKGSAASGEETAASDEEKNLRRLRDLLRRCAEQRVPDPGDPQHFEETIKNAQLTPEQKTALIGECRWSRPLQEFGCQATESPALTYREIGRSSADSEKELADPSEEVIQYVAQVADSHYHDIWHALGREEQHLLAQVASGCLVNRGLRQQLHRLLAWNLVVRDKLFFRRKNEHNDVGLQEKLLFRTMNESFRRFVLDRYEPKALRAWEQEAATGLLRHMRIPLYFMLAAGILFMVVTQPGLFDITIALVSTAVASLPGLVSVFSTLRSSQSAA